MRWVKILSIFLILLFGLFWFIKGKSSTPSPTAAIFLNREIASVTKNMTEKKLNQSAALIVITPKIQNRTFQDRTPQSLQSEYRHDPSIVVSKGNEFISNVGAILKSDYTPRMGPIIHEDMGLVFFKTESNHNFIPVAQSRMTRALYPISSVLHIEGVKPSLRDDILSLGYSEHYYQPRVQFLSIKSDPSNIMKTYSDLRQKGYNVQLEVLTPHHKTFN
jgi:hypothetical protein